MFRCLDQTIMPFAFFVSHYQMINKGHLISQNQGWTWFKSKGPSLAKYAKNFVVRTTHIPSKV